LKLIQMIASKGRITTSDTLITVGASSAQARRASRLARAPVPVGGVAEDMGYLEGLRAAARTPLQVLVDY
jgi:hypothetical protein